MAAPAPQGPPADALLLSRDAHDEAGLSPASSAGSTLRTLAGGLRRSRRAWFAAALLALVVGASAAAPLYAHDVAHTNPFASNLEGTTQVGGKTVPVIQQGTGALRLGENPIGPTWDPRHFLLGADGQGRDVAARLLYGGRNSLEIGLGAACISALLAVALALVAGAQGGAVDFALSRLIDVIWGFPVLLFAISLATVLVTSPNGLTLGPVAISPTSHWLPTLIIAVIFIPYFFRPVRGHVLALREQEFVLAAVAQGSRFSQIVLGELLPNVVPVVAVLLPLLASLTILSEAALSFLGIGVQAPDVSWGTMIGDGQQLLYTKPWVSLAPGVMIVLTVIALNVLGDVVRDILDPRHTVRAR